jgi:hypothetical protein
MKLEKIIYHKPKYRTGHNNLQLLRVILTNEHCKFDFGYQATDYYIKGGWIKISKDTFIRVQKNGLKYTLTKADKIPIAPNKHNFKTTKDWLYFSLYFPPISIKNGFIDLIEAEPGKDTDFNFWDIELNKENGINMK